MFYIRTHSECIRSKSKGCIIKMCTDISSRSICPSMRRWNKDQATCLHDGVDVGRSQLVFCAADYDLQVHYLTRMCSNAHGRRNIQTGKDLPSVLFRQINNVC